jgi:hypothetical protein
MSALRDPFRPAAFTVVALACLGWGSLAPAFALDQAAPAAPPSAIESPDTDSTSSVTPPEIVLAADSALPARRVGYQRRAADTVVLPRPRPRILHRRPDVDQPAVRLARSRPAPVIVRSVPPTSFAVAARIERSWHTMPIFIGIGF